MRASSSLPIVLLWGDHSVTVRIHLLEASRHFLISSVKRDVGLDNNVIGLVGDEESDSRKSERHSTQPAEDHCTVLCELRHPEADDEREACDSQSVLYAHGYRNGVFDFS